ncbi:MAG: zf-TFIIB domain-containing protein [Planctomycetota bacterium]|jgi:Zn-finger nucleic acid-binding protein|nr:zf-TFIIB domain-containing protein [Planctomycetota bacterium]
MNCPHCQNTLTQEDYEGVEIDRCTACEGIYLDDGELKHINDAREKTFSPEEISAVDGIQKQVQAHSEEAVGSIQCPKCTDSQMNRQNYAGQTGIVIDRCPNCKGLWLDAGEVEKIQIMVEGWEGEQSADLQSYGARMQEVASRAVESGNPYRGRIMRAIYSGFFDHFSS